jgi:glycerate kinase
MALMRKIIARPMADGGEGTLDAILTAVGDTGRRSTVPGPRRRRPLIDADYGLLKRDGETIAVVEIAQVVGITDRAGMAVNVGRRTDAWRR